MRGQRVPIEQNGEIHVAAESSKSERLTRNTANGDANQPSKSEIVREVTAQHPLQCVFTLILTDGDIPQSDIVTHRLCGPSQACVSLNVMSSFVQMGVS